MTKITSLIENIVQVIYISVDKIFKSRWFSLIEGCAATKEATEPGVPTG
jgi:hypothetical protein